VERAEPGAPADLRLVDEVAPSQNPAWFLRRFRCAESPVCSIDADSLLDQARTATTIGQRNALLADADRAITERQLFIPLAAPVRWSLVARSLAGFTEDIFAAPPFWVL